MSARDVVLVQFCERCRHPVHGRDGCRWRIENVDCGPLVCDCTETRIGCAFGVPWKDPPLPAGTKLPGQVDAP